MNKSPIGNSPLWVIPLISGILLIGNSLYQNSVENMLRQFSAGVFLFLSAGIILLWIKIEKLRSEDAEYL